jgi:hypothetical protein
VGRRAYSPHDRRPTTDDRSNELLNAALNAAIPLSDERRRSHDGRFDDSCDRAERERKNEIEVHTARAKGIKNPKRGCKNPAHLASAATRAAVTNAWCPRKITSEK